MYLHMQVIWRKTAGEREKSWLKNSFSALCILLKKPKYEFRVGWAQGSLNFIFSITSVNLKYGDIFFFPNKLKFHDSSNCTKLLIREQKIIHKSVLHINFTRLDVRIFYAFEELSEVANIM